ncbi:MAG: energy-coupling factor ABC transporter ATP-binding protein [Acidiferrobacterales bacterium]
MNAEPLIRFLDIQKYLGGRRLLDIAELTIRQASCMILSGDNGAGKTTLLKILAGLEPPDKADVSYQGKVLPWRIACRHYRRHVVYLHQTPYLFDRSVTANIAYGLHHTGIARADIDAQVDNALTWAGLDHLAKRNARQLSTGEKQRVALARARILSPQVLLLDEPTASMDYESRERTYFLIQRLKSEGIGVVITSHELQRISSLADEHVHLHGGKLYSDFDRPAGELDLNRNLGLNVPNSGQPFSLSQPKTTR